MQTIYSYKHNKSPFPSSTSYADCIPPTQSLPTCNPRYSRSASLSATIHQFLSSHSQSEKDAALARSAAATLPHDSHTRAYRQSNARIRPASTQNSIEFLPSIPWYAPTKSLTANTMQCWMERRDPYPPISGTSGTISTHSARKIGTSRGMEAAPSSSNPPDSRPIKWFVGYTDRFSANESLLSADPRLDSSNPCLSLRNPRQNVAIGIHKSGLNRLLRSRWVPHYPKTIACHFPPKYECFSPTINDNRTNTLSERGHPCIRG